MWVLGAMVCAGLATADVSKRIVGGMSATFDDLPFIAYLEFEVAGAGSRACSGQFVNSHSVLTAAHCCDQARAAKVYWGEQRRDASLTIVHPEYVPASGIPYNDLCVLRMGTAVAGVESVILADRYPKARQAYLAAGFGGTSADPTSSRRLQAVDLVVDDPVDCNRAFGGVTTRGFQFVCAGSDQVGRDTCFGDSGGPFGAYENNSFTLYGVTSFGVKNCGAEDGPSVSVNVAYHRDWIRAQTEPSVSSSPRQAPSLAALCLAVFFIAVDLSA